MKKQILMAALLGAVTMTSGAVMAEHHEGKMMGKHKHKMMEKIDTNGDGLISKSEFMAGQVEKFKKMDLNGDGSLSKEEKKAAYQARKEQRHEMKEKRKMMKEEKSY